MKVDFLVAGKQKAGTTTLEKHLRRHPDICLVKIKEVDSFYRG